MRKFLIFTSILSHLFVSSFVDAKPKKKDLKFEILAPSTYARLSKKDQKNYVNQIRKAWLDFEKNIPQKKVVVTPLWQRFLWETADAEDTSCVIGGAILVAVKKDNKYVCPTKGRTCDGHSDGFLCGKIFGGPCVSRTPISDLSERCYTASKDTHLTREEYLSLIDEMSSKFQAVCLSGTNTFVDGCRTLSSKLDDISNKHSIILASLIDYQGGVRNFSTPVTPGNQPSWTNAYGVNIPGCPNGQGLDRSILPRFSLEPEHCTFKSNKEILTKLGRDGCTPLDKMDNLFTTAFRTTDRYMLRGQTSVLDGIIEEITVLEKTSDTNIKYNVQMLTPDLRTRPPKLERLNFTLIFENGKYYFVDPISHEREEVTVGNTYRPNFLVENVRALDTLFDGKAIMADNCMLAAELKARGLYQSTAPKATSGSEGSQ